MPSDIMMFAAAAARKKTEMRSGLDHEDKRAAFQPIQRRDFRKPSTKRKQQSRTTRQKTLSNYKENDVITPAKEVTRFNKMHKPTLTKDIEFKRLDYSAVEAKPKVAKVTPHQMNALRARSRFSEVGTFINNAVEQKVNADFLLGPAEFNTEDGASIMPVGKHSRQSDFGSHIADTRGCGSDGPAILGLSAFEADDGATIMPQGKHSRQSDFGSHIADTRGCGTDGPAILGPAEYNAEEGATIMPQGKHSRQSDFGSHIADTRGCGTDGPAILGPAEYNADEGATIMPQGKHSRQSDFGSHITDTRGCGTDGPAILGPAEYNAEEGATIMPQGKHSRQSDFGSHIADTRGCGARGPAILGPSPMKTKGGRFMPKGRHSRMSDFGSYIVDKQGCGPRAKKVAEANAAIKEEMMRARADTVEQEPEAMEEVLWKSYNLATSDVRHVDPTPAPTKKPKRLTAKNFRQWGMAIQAAFAPKFKTADFIVHF